MTEQRFSAQIEQQGAKTFIVIPFDPADAWGVKTRYHVTGTINGHAVRGALDSDVSGFLLSLGPAWLREAALAPGSNVAVVLAPEGPQSHTLADDLRAELAAEPPAQDFFDSLPTFYRKNYLRWIDSAKRPETRSARIVEMIKLLKDGKRDR